MRTRGPPPKGLGKPLLSELATRIPGMASFQKPSCRRLILQAVLDEKTERVLRQHNIYPYRVARLPQMGAERNSVMGDLNLAEQYVVASFERFMGDIGPVQHAADEQGDYWRVRTNAAKTVQIILDRIGRRRVALQRRK